MQQLRVFQSEIPILQADESLNLSDKKSKRDFVMVGDAIEALAALPKGIVQTIVTSPPYYGQRDYKADGQIGHESTPEQIC